MIDLYKGEHGWLAYSYDEATKVYFLHTTIKGKWNKTKYREFLNIFTDAMLYLEEIDITTLLSVCYDPKSIKFNKLFGFYELVDTVDDAGRNVTVMRYDNVWE